MATNHKLKKKKERERKNRSIKAMKADPTSYQNLYPDISIENTDLSDFSTDFVKSIKLAIRSINLSDESLFLAEGTRFFKMIKKNNAAHAITHYITNISEDYVAIKEVEIGHLIFEYFKENEIFSDYFPFHSISVAFINESIKILLEKLDHFKSYGYATATNKKVSIGNDSYVVVFPKHAIKQFFTRVVGDWSQYQKHSIAYAALQNSIIVAHIEDIAKTRSIFMVKIYATCNNKYLEFSRLDRAITEYSRDKTYYFLAGYFPAILKDGFAIAKTMLIPGMGGTPEWDCVYNSSDKRRKYFLSLIGTHITEENLLNARNFRLYEFLKSRGLAQIVDRDGCI